MDSLLKLNDLGYHIKNSILYIRLTMSLHTFHKLERAHNSTTLGQRARSLVLIN